MTLSPRRLLNAMWSYLTQGITADSRKELEERLAAANDAHAVTVPTPGSITAAMPQVRGRAIIPGTSTHGIRPPSWWKGDRAAYKGMRAAAAEIEPTALRMADARGV
jgi:hypothetical protein